MAGRLRERLAEARKAAEPRVTEAAYDAVRAQQLRAESKRSLDEHLRARAGKRAENRAKRKRTPE
jgi:hypothetical protein